jgi:hypothetical protein
MKNLTAKAGATTRSFAEKKQPMMATTIPPPPLCYAV